MFSLFFTSQSEVWDLDDVSACDVERFNRLHPDQTAQRPYINQVMDATEGPVIAATDYMKIVPDQLSPWLGNRLVSLGTDGFGRSESREYLRRFYEMDAHAIAAATLSKLAREGKITVEKALKGFADLGINPDVADPSTV